MRLRTVRLQIELVIEDTCVLLVNTAAFLAQVVTVAEVLPQKRVVGVVVLAASPLAEMTPEVMLAKVHEQVVIIQVALFTKVALRVPSVRRVVFVADASVSRQIRASVDFALRGKELEVAFADFAVIQRMLALHVLLQLLEIALSVSVRTERTPVLEQHAHGVLKFPVLETNAQLSVTRQTTNSLNLHEQLDLVNKHNLCENNGVFLKRPQENMQNGQATLFEQTHLFQIFSADRTVLLATQTSHASAAAITYRMVTLSQSKNL